MELSSNICVQGQDNTAAEAQCSDLAVTLCQICQAVNKGSTVFLLTAQGDIKPLVQHLEFRGRHRRANFQTDKALSHVRQVNDETGSVAAESSIAMTLTSVPTSAGVSAPKGANNIKVISSVSVNPYVHDLTALETYVSAADDELLNSVLLSVAIHLTCRTLKMAVFRQFPKIRIFEQDCYHDCYHVRTVSFGPGTGAVEILLDSGAGSSVWLLTVAILVNRQLWIRRVTSWMLRVHTGCDLEGE